MIALHGRRLAAKCLRRGGKDTVAARGFFEAVWRWSSVGCQSARRGEHSPLNFITSTDPLHSVSAASIHTTCAETSIQHPARDPRRTTLLLRWTRSSSSSSSAESPIESPTKPPTESPTEPAKTPLSTTFRLLMRTLPQSVVVVTSSKPRYVAQSKGILNPPIHPTKPKDYRGITLSSFTTLTLEPEPIISFNIKYPSETYAAIAQSKHFLVHVLEGSEDAMLIADAFAKGSQYAKEFIWDHVWGGMKRLGVAEVKVMTRFKGKTMSLPMLKAKSVMRVFRCSVMTKSLRVADHMVVFARVEEILEGGEGGLEGKTGLCYADGRYWRVRELKEIKQSFRPTLAHFIQSPPDHPLTPRGQGLSKGL